MRSLGVEGIAEKSDVAAAKQLSASDSTKNGAWEHPFPVLRGDAPALPGAAYDARPRRGVPQPGRGFAR